MYVPCMCVSVQHVYTLRLLLGACYQFVKQRYHHAMLSKCEKLTWNMSSSSAKAAEVRRTVGELLKTVPSTLLFTSH